MAIRQSLGAAVPPGLPDAFSLADPQTVTGILEAAGFAGVSAVLMQLDPAAAERAIERLREALAEHLSDDGVWFNSRAWIVTARRR